ncbi:MAG: hypothetical protein JWQ04_2117 [Pedosphaera sp.]|nr:hypothetical protein [Pedosphaera sp.]
MTFKDVPSRMENHMPLRLTPVELSAELQKLRDETVLLMAAHNLQKLKLQCSVVELDKICKAVATRRRLFGQILPATSDHAQRHRGAIHLGSW